MTAVLSTLTLARLDDHRRRNMPDEQSKQLPYLSIPIQLPASLETLISHPSSQTASTAGSLCANSGNGIPSVIPNVSASSTPRLDARARRPSDEAHHSLSPLRPPPDRYRVRMRPSGPIGSTRNSREYHNNSSSLGSDNAGSGMINRRHVLEHRPRSSNASSCFIHTVKTASLSNYSLSIMPRSLKFGSFGYSQGFSGLQARYSLDSERPETSSCLLDEPAFTRGVKRRQIIDELIMTEESYVADLKALVYLYSTLLVSTSSISDHLRLATQRNVADLLHIHERLLENFHQAAFKSAARKWADTKSPTQLRQSHKTQGWFGSNSPNNGGYLSHRRAASSVGSAELNKARVVLGTAEPADVLDVTAAFDCIIEELFVYEEYCANHEIISGELQKYMPSLWSTYESGIESLNRALVALSRRKNHDRKGLTVGDLLIKPVQRICKYPLLLEDLSRQTPVIDGPGAHHALQSLLNRFRGVVQAVNIATDNHFTRAQIQRKWLLQDRINLDQIGLPQDLFRTVGNIQLCGVLFLAFQTSMNKVEGKYAVCMLFDNTLLIAMPGVMSNKLEVYTIITLSDLKVESAACGKGLQSASALYTWKICFAAEGNLHEILLSACSKFEEDQWVFGLCGGFRPAHFLQISTQSDESKVFGDVKCLGSSFRPFLPLSRHPSIQRAATVGNRDSPCQVILHNTHNAQDLHEYRHGLSLSVGRSRSHATANKVVVLAPKRTERTRLEASFSDVYTKDRLPFPGMIGSKGGQIIRASAGSLVRKLSLASTVRKQSQDQQTVGRQSARLSQKENTRFMSFLHRKKS